MSQNQPFNPDEFAKWLVDGVKDTLHYRLKQVLNREQILELLKSKIPTRNQLFHGAMKQAFIKSGFTFETLQQGDAPFQLIRKKNKKEGKIETRLIMIPGFGDTPASWITTYTFLKGELEAKFDEILIIDFPGYLGFLSHVPMVPSMEVLLGAVKTICEANPPTVLMGHSLGGSLAGKVAQELSKPIEHLILVAPSGLPPENEFEHLPNFVKQMKEAPFEDMIKKLVHEPRKYYLLLKNEFDYFYSKPEIPEFIASVKGHHFIDPKKEFATKKLTIIWGDQDQFVPAHWMRYWVECFGPYMDGYLINNTGHLPQLEHPKIMSDLIKEILFSKRNADEDRWRKIVTHTKGFDLSSGVSSATSSNLLTHTK